MEEVMTRGLLVRSPSGGPFQNLETWIPQVALISTWVLSKKRYHPNDE
jgi:hypothetical protein